MKHIALGGLVYISAVMAKREQWTSKPAGKWQVRKHGYTSSEIRPKSGDAFQIHSSENGRVTFATRRNARGVREVPSTETSSKYLFNKRVSRQVNLPDGSKISYLRKDVLDHALGIKVGYWSREDNEK